MGYARVQRYKKNKNGKYEYFDDLIRYDVPLTYGGWKQNQHYDKQDGFKTRIYGKSSKSNLSRVPKKVIVEDVKYGIKDIYTDFHRNSSKSKCEKCNKTYCNCRKI